MADNVQKIISVELKAGQAINGIAQLNQLIQNEKDLMKQLTAENKKGSEQYAMAEKSVKELNRTKRQLQREIQAEVKLEREQTGSLNELRNQLSDLTKKYDSLSRAERENVNVGGKLQRQINQVTTEIKNAEQSTQRYYRNVGNYQNAIIGALGMNNRYIQSMMLIASSSQGASGAFGAMATSVKAFGKALWGLMANPAFLAIAGIVGAGMAFKWFYDYNVEVEKALRLTREFTGVSGNELMHLRAEIQATASTYGKEYKEVLEGVDLLMSHFHMTSTEAMRTLNDGFMIGADINGNYLQLLKQYAPVFKDAGFSAQQLVALIQQTRSGIFSEKGLEAIKQASARLREMSSSTRASLTAIGIDVDKLQQQMQSGDMVGAIQTVTDRLKTLNGNTQEYGNVMADVFGRQGKFSSQEMIESLGDIDTNLQNLKESAGEYGKAMDENQQATADLEEASAKFFGVGENGWETLKTRADTYWKQALTKAINKTHSLIDEFVRMARQSNAFRQAAQIVAGVIGGFTFSIVDMFRNIGNGFKAVGSWIDAFVNTWKSAFKIIKDLGKGVGDILTGNISQGIAEIQAGLSNGITNALKGINTALKDTKNAVRGAWGAFTKGYDFMDNFFDNYKPTPAGAEGSWGGGGGTTDTTIDTSTNTGNGGGGSSRKRGSGNTRKPSTPKRASTTAKSGKTEEEKAEEERQKRIQALIKKGAELEQKAREEAQKQTAEGIVQMYKERADAIFAQFEGIETKTTEEAEALMKAKNTMLKANLEAQKKDLDKLKAEQDKKIADEKAKAQADAKALTQALLDGTTEGTQAHLDYQLELIRMEKEAELALYENNEAMKQAIIAKYNKQEEDARKQHSQAIQQIESTKYEAIGTMVGGLGEIVGAFGEQSKEAAVLQKTLALGEIMIAQAVAIANAVKAGSNAVSPWQMIAQIATSIVAVTTAMAQAFASLDSARFATGGYVRGAGTGTSDSIPVRVSNGESIMNANTTAMFSGLLSSLNQLGGGVPFQATQSASSIQGEDMLARAVAKGVAMLPNPVVSVEDINRGQRQVAVMNERARL